jgi:ketosteroid isomerase-like protein
MSEKGLSEKDTVWVRDAIDSWTRCLEAEDYDAWATYWTEDGVLMPPGRARVHGRDNLIAFIRENFGGVRTMNLTDWTIEGRADLAVVTTNVSWHLESAVGQEPEGSAKQLIEMRKNAEGRWLVKTVIYN